MLLYLPREESEGLIRFHVNDDGRVLALVIDNADATVIENVRADLDFH